MSEAYPSVALYLEEKLLKMDQAFRYMTMPDPSIRANLGYDAQPSYLMPVPSTRGGSKDSPSECLFLSGCVSVCLLTGPRTERPQWRPPRGHMTCSVRLSMMISHHLPSPRDPHAVARLPPPPLGLARLKAVVGAWCAA